MKSIIAFLGATIIASFILVSCGQNNNKQKELELRERELALKEKEFTLKVKDSLSSAELSSNSVNSPKKNIEVTTSSNEDYNYAQHSEFQTFWKDFKRAVNAGDKDAVAKMTNIPFKDKYREALSMVEGIGEPLTSNSVDEFKINYNRIFSSDVVKTLNSNSFIKYESRQQLGNSSSDFKKGEYYLYDGNDGEGLLFSRRSGIYKLICIPKYDMTFGGM